VAWARGSRSGRSPRSGAPDVGLGVLMQPRGGRANPISRASGLLVLSRPGDPVYRQVCERADRFSTNDGRGDRLRPTQRERRDRLAAARSECRGAWRILFRRSRRARGFDLSRPCDRNLPLQFLALRNVGRAGRREDLRPLTAGRRHVRRLHRTRLVVCYRDRPDRHGRIDHEKPPVAARAPSRGSD
jgi:hypothetical protein